MRAAIVTFVYNELVNLPIWRKYYSQIFGEKSLFVVDHDFTDGSTDDLGQISTVQLPRDELDEHKRCVFMGAFHKSLLQYFDTVVYTDCDEIIVPDLNKYENFADYLERMSFEYVAPIGLNIQHIITHELPLDDTEPILQQRKYCRFVSKLCKPLISKVPLVWDTGFHACNMPINIDPSLYLFHLKHMDYSIALRRHKINREMKWAESSITANHGAHARYDYPQFVREGFLDPLNILSTRGVSPFEFSAITEKLKAETIEKKGIFYIPNIHGYLVEIPDHLRGAF